jgi:Fe-S oxidoreductase
VLVEKEACCGMPKLELGDLESVQKNKDANIPVLAKVAREGYAILTPIPSCTLMFKQELPLMFPADSDVKAVRDAMFDPFEYLVLRNRDGLLKTDFKADLGNVSYHIPCHSRVQNVGQKTREMLQLIPGTAVKTVERCAGHDGTWGVKTEYFENSMKIGRPVFRLMGEESEGKAPRYISSDCPIAARHIEQGMEGSDAAASNPAPEKAHPISLLRKAYGI